ncbi:unnamed protein product [Prunus armeniaca]
MRPRHMGTSRNSRIGNFEVMDPTGSRVDFWDFYRFLSLEALLDRSKDEKSFCGQSWDNFGKMSFKPIVGVPHSGLETIWLFLITPHELRGRLDRVVRGLRLRLTWCLRGLQGMLLMPARIAARIEVVSLRPARIAAQVKLVPLRPARMELMVLMELTDHDLGYA